MEIVIARIVYTRAPRRRRVKPSVAEPKVAAIVGPRLQSLDPDPETLRRADKSAEVWAELVRRPTAGE